MVAIRNAVYGISSHKANGPDYFLYGAGGKYVSTSDGGFVVTLQTSISPQPYKAASIMKDGEGITIRASWMTLT